MNRPDVSQAMVERAANAIHDYLKVRVPDGPASPTPQTFEMARVALHAALETEVYEILRAIEKRTT